MFLFGLGRDDDLMLRLSTFEHQLDSTTFTCIYETLKANQFITRLKIKLIRDEKLNLMFQKELSLGAKALLSYQISLLRNSLLSKSQCHDQGKRN